MKYFEKKEQEKKLTVKINTENQIDYTIYKVHFMQECKERLTYKERIKYLKEHEITLKEKFVMQFNDDVELYIIENLYSLELQKITYELSAFLLKYEVDDKICKFLNKINLVLI